MALMPRGSRSQDELQMRLSELAGWRTATRNDGKVVLALHKTREMDHVYGLDVASFYDELFNYIKEIGAWPLFEALDHGEREGALYPFIRFVMLMMMRCVGGVQSMLAMHDVLLTDEALMSMVGFNAVQVREGATARGLSRRTKPVEVRGAISFETVADNVVRIGLKKLVAMFNGVVRCLAARKVFARKLDVVLDATDDEATPKYETEDGRAVPKVTREKRPDVRNNKHATKVAVTVWGWKVWVVYEPQSKIPLAIYIDDINVPDNQYAYEVLEQARRNVAGHAVIRSVALDRGFIDGKLLHAVDKAGTILYIPAKSNMTITTDAREIARRAEKEAAEGRKVDGCMYVERTMEVNHGSGKKAWIEKRTTAVVGIRDLPCDWWGEEGCTSKANSKYFKSKMVNATVVLRWEGKEIDAGKEVVILTTDPSEDPFAAFDAYDDRSLIENTCNREAKEHWFLEHHPKRSEAGVRVQAYFVFVCMALVTAFRMDLKRSDEVEQRGGETGITRYRRKIESENRHKVAVFIDDNYAIIWNHEFAMLLGAVVKDRALMGDTVETVLRKYGAVGTTPDTS